MLFPRSLHGKTRFAPDAKKQWLFLERLDKEEETPLCFLRFLL